MNIACPASEFCCGTTCCNAGELCCNTPGSPLPLPSCHAPVDGTCPAGP
jgi:hypothetical protein